MIKQIAAVVLVFIFTAFAWVFLGTTVAVRTQVQDGTLRGEVGQLWGTPQRQTAPVVTYEKLVPATVVSKNDETASVPVPATNPPLPESVPPAAKVPTATPSRTAPHLPRASVPPAMRVETATVPLAGSDVDVNLELEHRAKGLLWYSTYRVEFAGAYRIANPTDEPRDMLVDFTFPNADAIYDNFRLAIGGREVENLQMNASTVRAVVPLGPGETETVDVSYGSQGLDEWWYEFGTNVNQARNFTLHMHTNFDEIDFPGNSISPTAKERTPGGWNLEWQYSNLLSGVQIGMGMPQKLNPGPWVSSITFFAPVSLFFFFFLLFMFSTLQRVHIHPMNYFFIGTGFFAFHLLLAYLVDHISIHMAFVICSIVSLFLVISYMRLVVGHRFAIVQVGISQFVYLVLFSYTFFFEKYTGLAVTILSILTLFVVMQMTGRTDWERLFARGSLEDTDPGTLGGGAAGAPMAAPGTVTNGRE